MSSDSHTWEKGTQELDMPYYLAYFRGENNKTRVELYYGLSIEQLLKDEQNVEGLIFKHGAGIYDLDWTNIKEFSRDVTFQSIRENFFIHRFHFDLEPGTYHSVLYANLPSTKKWGGDNFEIEVPVIAQKGFGISDLELAFDIIEAERESIFKNGKFEVIPNPGKVFNKSNPVHVYFEIYNLKKDQTGETRFTIEYTMSQLKGSFQLFGGGKKEVISVKNDFTGFEHTYYETAGFDVTKLEPGEYRLAVKVKDLNLGKTSERSIDLKIK